MFQIGLEGEMNNTSIIWYEKLTAYKKMNFLLPGMFNITNIFGMYLRVCIKLYTFINFYNMLYTDKRPS